MLFEQLRCLAAGEEGRLNDRDEMMFLVHRDDTSSRGEDHGDVVVQWLVDPVDADDCRHVCEARRIAEKSGHGIDLLR